jgi:hypothetical protein
LKFEVNQRRSSNWNHNKKKRKEGGRWHGSEEMEIKQTYKIKSGGRKEEI